MVKRFVIALFAALPLFANDLTVDKRTMQIDDTLTIVVSLEDAFASVDTIRVPVQNLEFDGLPSTSSQYSWINGTVVRRKVFRFTAHPLQAGGAMVGPLRINGDGGQRETLPAISIQVLPDTATSSNDPAAIFRDLVATGREPFFVVASIDRTTAYVGEEIIATWTLYNGATVQQWQIGRVPKLDDFWTEELDVRNEQPSRALVDGVVLQTLPIRRVALFPLRSGTLDIGSMEIGGAVMRRIDAGPFGLFEGSLVEVRFPSAQMKVDVKPIPPGPPVDAVGDFTLACSTPIQKGGGPVVVEATLSGRGNLRAAVPPRWESKPDADVQVEDAGVTVDRTRDIATMRRRWKFLLSPRQTGRFTVPALVTTIFDPSTGERRVLRSNVTVIDVQTAQPVVESPAPASMTAVSISRYLPWLGAIAFGAIVLIASVAMFRRRRSVTGRAGALVDDRSPAEVRAAVHELLAKRDVDPDQLLRESSERGDAYRAVRSIADAIESDRIDDASGRVLLRERIGDLLEVIG